MCVDAVTQRAFIALLEKFDVVYRDCAGVIQGDCTMCGGGGGEGGPTTNTLSFNPATNVLTVTVNGVAATTTIVLDAGDIRTTSPLTFGGTTYPTNTSVQTILGALAVLAHPAASLTNNAAAFSWDSATQVGNIPQSGNLVNNGNGTFTFIPGNGNPGVTIPFADTATTVLTTAAVTINGTVFPIGTTLQAIVNAFAPLAHPVAVVTNSGSVFSWNPTTQTLNVPLYLVTVSTTARLSGNGTSGSPLDLAQQGAATGDVLKWNGTSWAPATDNAGGVTDGDKGDLTVSASGTVWTIDNNAVDNLKTADMAANTVKVNNTAALGNPVDMAVPLNTLVGRGDSGNIVPVTLGTNLAMSGGTLNAISMTGGDTVVESDTTLIVYQVVSGTPVVSASRTGGVQTITVTGGTVLIKSVATKGVTADLAGDNSFKIAVSGVMGTALLAYPIVAKWNLSGLAPSEGVPHIQDTDNTPQVQVTAGTAGTSVTVRVVNLNAFTDWAIKCVW